MSRVIANYEHARELFNLLLATDAQQRILLMDGASGTGKSTLLLVVWNRPCD